MDNWGLWAVLSLPLFFAMTNRLRGLSKDIAVWAYLWAIGGLWGVSIWRNYHRYVAFQRMDLGPRGPELLSQNLHVLWASVILMAFLMALPVFWYVRDRRKLRLQSAG